MGESSLIEHRSFTILSFHSELHSFTNSPNGFFIYYRNRSLVFRTNGQHIAMTVRNLTTLEWRVDIFSFHMQRIFRGESLGYAAYFDYWCCVLTPYRSSSWLVMNNTSKQETVIFIDRQAQIRQQIELEGYNIAVLQGEQPNCD